MRDKGDMKQAKKQFAFQEQAVNTADSNGHLYF